MAVTDDTFIGSIESVSGSSVSVKIRENLSSTLLFIRGESYRIGQLGGFLRIPLGYTQLYGVCTQVGAAAVPVNAQVEQDNNNRWLTLTLFGESVGGFFDRGVSQYPTVGDEVHIVTGNDLEIIYGSVETNAKITVGSLAASSGIPGDLDLAKLVSRHCTIVGSTGSGKSNLVAVLLESIAQQDFPNARTLVIDPHGEYDSCVGNNGYVFKINPDDSKGEKPLEIPFWALPFDELKEIVLGNMQQSNETAIRDRTTEMKRAVAPNLSATPPDAEINADSPIPYDIRELWFYFDDLERRTYEDNQKTKPAEIIEAGSAKDLKPNKYKPHSPGGAAPYAPKPKGIQKNLEFMRSRLKDDNYKFLFDQNSKYRIDADGKPIADIDKLVASWVGHDRQITVLDVSGLPSETTSTIVGTLLRIVYDTLFWAGDLPVSGKNQPLLIVLEEAHLFLPEGKTTSAHRTIAKIAKEGRKYGVGLVIITQRPTEIDSAALSQCGTMIALRLTNSKDRSVVSAAMPDDLGDLGAIIPSLRTGEALVIGEAMPIPSRIQFRKAMNKPIGDSPDIAKCWRAVSRPDPKDYQTALVYWRARSFDVQITGE